MIGVEAVNQLLVQWKHRFDFCFIGAGFMRIQVDEFLTVNPGLAGRISTENCGSSLILVEIVGWTYTLHRVASSMAPHGGIPRRGHLHHLVGSTVSTLCKRVGSPNVIERAEGLDAGDLRKGVGQPGHGSDLRIITATDRCRDAQRAQTTETIVW